MISNTKKIIAEAGKLSYSPMVELFTIDATVLGMTSPLYYHNYNAGGVITFQGVNYVPFPLEVKGFEFKTSGELPRPTLRMGNVAATVTGLCMLYSDLVGAKVTRRRTFTRFLDNLIKPNPPAFKSYGRIVDEVGHSTTYGSIADGTIPATAIVPVVSGSDNVFSIPTTIGTLYTLTDSTPAVIAIFQGGGDTRVLTDVGAATSGKTYTLKQTIWYGTITPSGTVANPDADPYAEYPPDIFYIDRKTTETKQQVEFELGISLDVEGIRLPLRTVVANTCLWLYRGAECGYAAYSPIADANDANLPPITTMRGEWDASATYNTGDGVYITTGVNRIVYVASTYFGGSFGGAATRPPNSSYWKQDICSKHMSGCKKRFDPSNTNAALPFGGFPGTSNFS